MAFQPTILERAFDLARSGEYQGIDEIRRKLKSERYDAVDAHISGSVVVSLRKLMSAA